MPLEELRRRTTTGEWLAVVGLFDPLTALQATRVTEIGNGDGEGACEVHNPGYDFNDGALPFGSALFCRLVERRLARMGVD